MSAFSSYPFVRCHDHGRQFGYFICIHVLQGERPSYVRKATAANAGVILCSAKHKDPDTCRIACAIHCGPYLARYWGGSVAKEANALS